MTVQTLDIGTAEQQSTVWLQYTAAAQVFSSVADKRTSLPSCCCFLAAPLPPSLPPLSPLAAATAADAPDEARVDMPTLRDLQAQASSCGLELQGKRMLLFRVLGFRV